MRRGKDGEKELSFEAPGRNKTPVHAMPKGGTLSFDTHNIEIDPTYCSTHPELHPGRYVLMAVTDTGCGMTPEYTGPVFL